MIATERTWVRDSPPYFTVHDLPQGTILNCWSPASQELLIHVLQRFSYWPVGYGSKRGEVGCAGGTEVKHVVVPASGGDADDGSTVGSVVTAVRVVVSGGLASSVIVVACPSIVVTIVEKPPPKGGSGVSVDVSVVGCPSTVVVM